jgi:RNA polymerase sigma-70 factor, ECF subfamily
MDSPPTSTRSGDNTPPRPDRALLDLIRGGDRAAAGELYERYARRLRDLASQGLAGGPFDADDVVQSAFRTFLATAGRGHYDVPDGRDLWALLAVVTLNKARSHARRAAALKRSPAGGLVGLTDTPAPVSATDPVGHAAAGEVLDRFPPHERALIELRVAGYEVAEIAARVGRSKRTVERLLRDCCQRLLALTVAHE